MKTGEMPDHLVNLALKEGATDVAVKLVDKDEVVIRFANNEVTVSKAFREVLFDIFLLIGKHRAPTAVPLSSKENLETEVRNLVKTAKITPPAEVYAPLPQGPFEYDPRLTKGSRISLEPDRLTGYVEEAINGALDAGAKKVAGTLVATRATVSLSTSGQVHVTEKKAGLEMSVRAFASDIASGHWVSISRGEKGLEPGEAGRKAGEIAKASSHPRRGEPGKFTALLGPMVFADLVNQVGMASSAFLVDIGQSFLAEKMDSEVASSEFRLIDDPTVADSFGAKAFDDEGVPTKRNTIVDRGVLKTYLHNSTTAKKFRKETTGNAGLFSPRPWNLMVGSGEKSFEELLAEVDKGIYVTNNWYLRYQNHRTGDFSTIPRDGMFLIRRGEISSCIRELRISDNMLRVMRNITELDRSRSWIKWWEVVVPTLAPCAVVEDVSFTKSSM